MDSELHELEPLSERQWMWIAVETTASVVVPALPRESIADGEPAAPDSCRCHSSVKAPGANGEARGSKPAVGAFPARADGRPDFARMDVAQRLAYHRKRLGLTGA